MRRKTLEFEPGQELRKNSNGKVQKVAMRRNSWSLAKRAKFLDHLAATCNVRESADAVDGLHNTAYQMRRRDPEFAEAWQAALETGYAAIETMLIGRARQALDIPVGETEVPDVETIDTDLAFRVLGNHRKAVVLGEQQGSRCPPRRATDEETYKALMKKLRVLKIRIERGEA